MPPISINVGGRIFTTSRETLAFSPYFSSLFDRWDTEKSGDIFIDRDPDGFKHVLRLLREPTYNFPSKWKAELLFFGVEEHVTKPTPRESFPTQFEAMCFGSTARILDIQAKRENGSSLFEIPYLTCHDLAIVLFDLPPNIKAKLNFGNGCIEVNRTRGFPPLPNGMQCISIEIPIDMESIPVLFIIFGNRSRNMRNEPNKDEEAKAYEDMRNNAKKTIAIMLQAWDLGYEKSQVFKQGYGSYLAKSMGIEKEVLPWETE